MPKTDGVPLSAQQRGLLYALIQQGTAPARTIRRAHPWLLADARQSAHTMAAMGPPSAVTVTHTCQQFLTAGLEAAL